MMWNWWIGSTARIIVIAQDFLSRTTPAARITLRTPAAKPSNRNTISPHGEIPEPAIEQPADQRADQNAGHQFGRKPETAGEPRSIGGAGRGPVSFSDGRLAVFEPFAETLEPRGESGLVVRRFLAITLSARVVSHAFDLRG